MLSNLLPWQPFVTGMLAVSMVTRSWVWNAAVLPQDCARFPCMQNWSMISEIELRSRPCNLMSTHHSVISTSAYSYQRPFKALFHVRTAPSSPVDASTSPEIWIRNCLRCLHIHSPPCENATFQIAPLCRLISSVMVAVSFIRPGADSVSRTRSRSLVPARPAPIPEGAL